ncbi:FecR family protein [Fodinibius roseus]|uniref:FecR family protein n=1 Tax=Fodinibius roseus TaxID=1194090 RepID=A0A1M5GSQ8_9BACT|nr:FecR domain-containing protein [Fodinibius roseus]SHG06701.1 FecR family protein [Fodinibius roseus]
MDQYSNIEDLLADDSFIRWISHSATEKERAHWEQWMAEDPAREVMVREAQKLHQSIHYDPFDTPDFKNELAELEETISQYETNRVPTERFSHSKSNYVHYWMRVAAVLLLTIVTGWGIYVGLPQSDPDKKEVKIEWAVSETEFGEKRALQLTDGSKIILNADSRLRYPQRHTGKELQVWLEGEAYFDIVHKTGADRRQFTVHTRDGDVRVLGTKFNVNTRKNQTEVVLEEGKVKIEKPDSSRSSSISHVMTPGEMVRFDSQQNRIDVQAINPELYTSWTEDRLVFEETPLHEIAYDLETIYGLEVRIASSELGEMLVSGTVSNDNLPVLLSSLSRLLEVDIDRREQLILITD